MKKRFFAGAAAALCCAGLAMGQSANDLCVNAQALSVNTPTAGAVVAADTNDSPTNTATTNGCSTTFLGTTRKSLYYTFTPAVSGLFNVSLCASSGTLTDTRMAIWAATDVTPGTVAPCTGSVAALACNDDSCGLRSNFNVSLTAGTGYIIQVAPFSTSATAAGTFTILVAGPQSAPAPANDDCAAPTVLSTGVPTAGSLTNATGVSTTVFTCGTTSTTGNDVWYSVTPSVAGTAAIDVCGNFDTIVNVLTAASTCAAPASLACNDDTIPTGCTLHGSRVTWTAVAGTTYLVRVAGVQHTATSTPAGAIAPTHGDFTVTFTEPQPSGVCCNFTTGACTFVTQASCGTAGSWTIGGSCTPDPCPKGACCNNLTGACTTGGTTCPAGATFQGANTTCTPTSPCPASGACCANSCCSVLIPAQCAAIGGTYQGDATTCTTNPCTAVPANDLCAAAIPVSVGTLVYGSNCGATPTGATETPVPSCQTSFSRTVWYTVTPATTGIYSLSLCGANFDCILEVFTTDCTTFTGVACDDDSCAGGEPGPVGTGNVLASFIAAAQLNGGQTYHLRVSSFGTTSSGFFQLLVSPNTVAGACCNATTGACTISATGSAGCGAGTTFLGGVCSPNPCPQPTGACCVNDGTCSVGEAGACTNGAFQGPGTTCSGAGGTCPATYGSCCNNTTGVCTYIVTTATCTGGTFTAGGVCAPNTCPQPGSCCLTTGCCSLVTATLCTTGTFTAGGTCTPNTCPGAPTNDVCSTAAVVMVGTTSGNNACATTDPGETFTCQASSKQSVWFDFTAPAAGTYQMDTNGSAQADTVLAVFSACGGTSLACDDDSGTTPANASLLTVSLTNGQNVRVLLGTWGSATSGGFVLNINIRGACCVGTACTVTIGTGCTGTFTPGIACGPNTCDPLGSCCAADGTCTEVAQSTCTGAFTLAGTCTPNTCPQPTGACCCGSTCSLTLAAACTGTNQVFRGAGTACNVFGTNNTAPCCFADYNQSGAVSVQDIFDFLAGYFSSDACADINGTGVPPTVQDIFDFLAAYFAGCV